MKRNYSGPAIVKDETPGCNKKMKSSKATHPGSSPVAILEALGDYENDKITVLLNQVYVTGQILKHISKSLFITPQKKTQGQQIVNCKETIRLMSHRTKSTFMNHHHGSQKQNQNRNSWGTVWLCGEEIYNKYYPHPSNYLNELWRYKRSVPVLHCLHKGIW